MNEIELAKSLGQYRRAGQLSSLRGHGFYYGCHYGMRSTRMTAIAEFEAGFCEIEELFRRLP